MSITQSNSVADTTAAPLLSLTNTDIHRSLGGGRIADLARPSGCRKETLSFVFELIWGTIIVSVAIVVLAVLSKGETTEVPLRVWIVGFGILRVLHVVCVCHDYSNLRQEWEADPENTRPGISDVSTCLHTVDNVLDIIWWIIGLYWMFSGGKSLADDAPKLFWSTVIFMALDLLVLLIFGFLSCILCVAGVCFLQYIMPIRTSNPNQNGENEDLIARLTRKISRRFSVTQDSSDGNMNHGDIDTPAKPDLAAENAAENVV